MRARTAASRSRREARGFAVHADGYRRDADDYDTPQGRQENTFVKSNGGSVGLSRVWDDGFIGVAYSRFESLYGIPGEEAVEENSRIDMVQDKVLAKGEWRPHALGIEAARFWFGASDYAHNELVDEGDVGSRFTNKEQEGRVEIQHVPVATSLGEMHGAVGMQIGHRDLTALSFEGGDNLLEPNTTHTTAGFIFEELQATAAPAPAGRGAHRALACRGLDVRGHRGPGFGARSVRQVLYAR